MGIEISPFIVSYILQYFIFYKQFYLILSRIFTKNIKMLYQLPNGKVIQLTIEEYLALTDLDIQYLMSLDYGEHIIDPFLGSAVEKNSKSKFIDTEFLPMEDYDLNDIPSDDSPFDDIIDLEGPLDN